MRQPDWAGLYRTVVGKAVHSQSSRESSMPGSIPGKLSRCHTPPLAQSNGWCISQRKKHLAYTIRLLPQSGFQRWK